MSAVATRLYVGGLSESATERDIRDIFERYGPLKDVWIARKPPGFAFVEYEDVRDAEDAERKLDGYDGMRVEFSRRGQGASRGPPAYGMPPFGMMPPPYMGYFGRMPPGGGNCYNCGQPGHIARDCRAMRGDLGGGYRRDSPPRRRYRSPTPTRYRSRSRSRSRRRSYSPRGRSRSRSRSPRRDSRSPSRGRSASPARRSRSASPANSRSPPPRSVSRSRSRS